MASSTAATLLLLSALFFSAPLLSHTAEVVLDKDGDPLRPGSGYYMNPLLPTPGSGGVSLQGPAGVGLCPRRVALSNSDKDLGIPVNATPAGSSTPTTVPVGGLVRLGFAILYRCIPTVPWSYEVGENGVRFVLPSVKVSWFTIEKSSHSKGYYYLKHCGGGRGTCEKVSLYHNPADSRWYLVVGGDEFEFSFIKYSTG